jgi:hypothetical protein
MGDLSRRVFLGAAAAVGAAAAGLPGAAGASSGAGAAATATPLAGAVVNPSGYHVSTFAEAAKLYDSWVGLPLAARFTKIYLSHGELGPVPTKMIQMAPLGCKFILSVEPSVHLSSGEQQRLAKFLAALTREGFSYRTVLYSEANDKEFKTAASWLAYWRFYAPVIIDATGQCGYDAGCGAGPVVARGEAYFPSRPYPSEVWLDFYATSYRNGTRLETMLALAAKAGAPVGLTEWGWNAANHASDPMTMPVWDEYCQYLTGLAKARQLPLGAINFAAAADGIAVDVLSGPKDARIKNIVAVSEAVLAQ